MAEAIGLAASVAGLASFAATVSIGLYECCHTLRHALDEINDMARDVSLFASVLEQLGKVLEAQKNLLRASSLHLVKNVVGATRIIFNEIDLAVKLRKGKAARVMWLFDKPKTLEIKAKMESLKSTLSILLQTVTLDTTFRYVHY